MVVADELQMVFLLTPRGLVIAFLGDPRNVAKELPPTVDTDVPPWSLTPWEPPEGKTQCCGNTSPLRLAAIPQPLGVIP
jgi:hypothetical protein